MFGQTVTVFSKHGATWYPRVFHDTQVARDRGSITRAYGETANETVSVHVKRKGYLATESVGGAAKRVRRGIV